MQRKFNGLFIEDNEFEKGPAVIFIHGFPFTHAMWKGQLELLADKCRTVAYDMRGHGNSETGDGQYTLELFADDLIGIMDYLKIKRAVLCGLSMGGYVALRTAERQPERVSGLILCDTKSEADGNEAKIKRAAGIAAVKKSGAASYAQEFVKAVLTPDTLANKPEIKDPVIKMISGNTPQGICGALLALAARTDTTAALPKVAVPTLILVGAEDKLTPPAVSESMAKAIPGASLVILPGAAHLSNLENPRAFNEELLKFLKRF